MSTPYVGMTVHYLDRPHDEPIAAIITHVHDDTWVGLCILGPGSVRFVTHVERDVKWKEITLPASKLSTPEPAATWSSGYGSWGGPP